MLLAILPHDSPGGFEDGLKAFEMVSENTLYDEKKEPAGAPAAPNAQCRSCRSLSSFGALSIKAAPSGMCVFCYRVTAPVLKFRPVAGNVVATGFDA
eukprot:9091722-Pyramimonas_sp.AAC.1